MTFTPRKFSLTLLLGLTLILAACGSATPEAVVSMNEPEPTSGLVAPAPTDVESAVEAPIATEASAPALEPAAVAGGVSFQNDIKPIFERSCLRCHGSRREEGLDLRGYAVMMSGSDNGPVIVPGDADASLLITQVLSGEMPRRAPKLPAEQLQILVDWVNQGALDN
jgi:mono/diheme cytochrome c family protein